MRETNQRSRRTLRHELSSAIICDVLDEFGFDGFIDSFESNIDTTIFGRSKTLSLRELQPGEDPDGIYEALKSYNRIVPGDIIVVESDCPEYAYFGELNAHLAVREGAQGALIDSRTRDVAETTQIGFPVYAKGTTPNDIKNKGTVAHMNKQVSINNTEIGNEDLVFADGDGAVVIPSQIEDDVIERSKEVASEESNVLSGISSDTAINNLTEKYGEF
jgi:regulator of RNase E activity RraA